MTLLGHVLLHFTENFASNTYLIKKKMCVCVCLSDTFHDFDVHLTLVVNWQTGHSATIKASSLSSEWEALNS